MNNPCWEGYEAYGMKRKGGRLVPNCVPKKSNSSSEMPYHLELGSGGDKFGGKAIVVNSMTGRHYSNEPIRMEKAKAQKRVLEAAEKKEKK
jgi:hypothetical protein